MGNMKNVFDVLPESFFKPLVSKYRRIYADVILLIYETFRPEISYGVNREIIVKVLMDIRSSFYRLDDIIEEIDRKGTTEDRGKLFPAPCGASYGTGRAGERRSWTDLPSWGVQPGLYRGFCHGEAEEF